MKSVIIPQYYQKYNSFKDLVNGKSTETNFLLGAMRIDPKEMLDFEQLFIIAEPGYGKTTLIKEIRARLDSDKTPYYHQNGIDNIDKKFEIPNGIEYYIFDALDENKDVIATFSEVHTFCSRNNIKLIFSNRSHYLLLIEHLLIDSDFKFIRLLPFEDHQIYSFLESNLKELNYHKDDIEAIILNSKVNSRTSILCVPRYLDEFCKYILQNKLLPSQIKQLTKSQLFEKVIYYKLETEDKSSKANSNQKYLTKRVLERLSLVMEIHELNQISKEDFITFLDQTDSNISLIFLNSIDLDVLLQRVMKATDEILQFENSEFQEYMAAKELTRLGYRFQTIYDLMIDPELQLLRPNWIDVLSFAVDMEPEFARPIITFIRTRKHETIDEKLIEILMNIPYTYFEPNFQDTFFETIFNYYTAKGRLIFSISERLSKFITDTNTDIYKPIYEPDNLVDSVRHVQSNQILLIESLSKSQKLSEEQKIIWVDYLLILSLKDELYSMHTTIFFGLIALGMPEPLFALIGVFEKKEDYVLNNFLMALTKMAPNDPRVIDLINRSIEADRNLNNLESSINNISDANGIISVFNKFSTVTKTLRNDSFRFGHGFYDLFKSVEALGSRKVDISIQNFLFASLNEDRYAHYLPKICEQALIYLIKKTPIFLKKIMSLKTFQNSVDEIAKSLVAHIDLKTFQLIEKFLIKHKQQWRLETMVRKVKYELEKRKDNPIYTYIDRKYLQVWAKKNVSYEAPRQKSNLEQLREYYIDDKTYFSPALIPLLVNNFNELDPLLEDNDRKEIKGVIAMILKSYEPDKFRVDIHEVEENKTSFSHNQETWFHIELYFKAAYLLGEKPLIKTYREKLLKTLPRIDIFEHQHKDMLENLVKSIGPITANDIQLIYDFCIGRTDDMLALSSRSLGEVAKVFKLHQLNPVLLMLVRNPKVKSFEKEETLAAFGELAQGDKDFNALKDIIKTTGNTQKLIDIANAALITNYKDKNAIIWRFDELKKRMKPFDTDRKYNGPRGVSAFESEMDHPEFPNCLYGINNPIIYSQMLELLTYSFTIRDKKLQFRYSIYLQQIVYTYYKTFLTRNVLSDLRKVTAKFPIVEHTYSFNTQLDELVKDLHQQKKNTEPFITAIQGLNQILSRVYLPINSNEELRELILKIINTEIKNLIENDGFYRVSDELKAKKDGPSIKVGEVIIQKTLKIALEKALLDNGLRKADIYREVESLDGLKYDYLISYGLYGPIMVELKLLHNDEIQNKKQRGEYKQKMIKYLGANNGQGIYTIFQIHNDPKQLLQYQNLLEEYKDINKLDIPLLQCYDDEPLPPKPSITKKQR